MKVYKINLSDRRVFFVTAYSKAEAKSIISEETGIHSGMIRRVSTDPDLTPDNEPGVMMGVIPA